MAVVLEERVDRLEALLGQFIVSTNAMMIRSERVQEEFKQEMKVFKDEFDLLKNKTNRVNGTTAERKYIDKQWGQLANKMGTIVEDIIAPLIPCIAQEYFQIDTFNFFAESVRKRKKTNPSIVREFDIVAVSDKYIIVNETKSTPKIEYINEFIEMLPQFKEYFPEYQDRTVLPIFSSLYLPEQIVQYLSKHNIYALGMSNETMDILNFAQISFAS